MFGEPKIKNSNVWKIQNQEFQCLNNPKSRLPMFRKRQTQEFQCLEKPTH